MSGASILGGRGHKRVPDRVLIEAYERLGSVHKVGAEVGIGGGSVHERLVRLGVARSQPAFTDAERARLLAEYERFASSNSLDALARLMGRTKPFLCRKAGELGLTRTGRAVPEWRKRKVGQAAAARNARQGHPRGMAGKRHAPEALAKMSAASVETWRRHKESGTGLMSPKNQQQRSDRMSRWSAAQPAANAYSRTKSGKRADLGDIHFRSSWEANYARFLNWLLERGEIDGWEYEPHTFWFEKIKRGVRSYLPDFRVTEKGAIYYVEVKGWMDAKSKTKLARMKRYHPTVDLRLVDAKQYRAMSIQLRRLIPNWEGA